MLNKSLGIIEVQGYSVALAAADAACKTSYVSLKGMDCNAPSLGDKAKIPLMVQVKLVGDIEDVKAALDAAKREAIKYNDPQDVFTYLIARPYEALDKLIKVGKVKLK